MTILAQSATADLLEATFSDTQVVRLPGPAEAISGFNTSDKGVHTVKLPKALKDKGSVSFWFQLDQEYRSKPGAEKVSYRLLECPGVFHFEFKAAPTHVELFWKWENRDLLVDRIRPVLPGLPGKQWIHFVVSWDAKAGIFDGWLNGTPLREPGTRVPSWEHNVLIDAIQIPPCPVSLAGLQVSDKPLEEKELQELIGKETFGNLRSRLGALDPEAKKIEPELAKRTLIYSNPLASEEDLGDWIIEGPLATSFENGALVMRSRLPDDIPRGHTVFWLKKELPSDFIAEWEMRPIGDRGLCIAFFSAKGRNGESIFDSSLQKREGEFPLYHSGDIDCYHVSYYAHTPETPGRLTANLRKNHGFYLIANGPPAISAQSRNWHQVTLRKKGAHIQLFVDGLCIIDFTDDGKTYGSVLGGGHFGLRQMVWSIAAYRNLNIWTFNE